MLVENVNHSDVDALITRSYQHFEAGEFDSAKALLDEAHSLDFENTEIQSALRACGFWHQRSLSLETLAGDGTRGDYLRRQWTQYAARYQTGFEHALADGSAKIKLWVHNEALKFYRKQASETSDASAMLQAGRCLKVLGRYEESSATLEGALRDAGGSDARLLAELADVYALVGETKPAKVLMREALFIDAASVDLDEIAAPLFRRLIDRLLREREGDPALAEWLPVYGALWGVLDVRRELTPVEYGRLKQSIYALNSEIADGDEEGRLKPKLINRYFRLIEHYQSTRADRTVIDETLINIKLLSPGIYREYFE